MLLTCYGSGPRICEAVSLQLSDIDSRRMLIRVEHGPSAAKPGGAAARANATHRATAEVPQDEDPQNG